MKQVIPLSDVLQYEPFGFTNCVRYQDVLYLSGIAALDVQGQVVGEAIETQTVRTFENIERILRAGGVPQPLGITISACPMARPGR
jgi:2-iminobutanoate/2-iminopropanoate deaminase